MSSSALLIGNPETLSETEALIKPCLSHHSIKLNCATETEFTNIPSPAILDDDSLSILVFFDHNVINPLPLARQLHHTYPETAFVFLVIDSNAELYNQLKSPIAQIGSSWNMVNLRSDSLASDLMSIIEFSRKKSQFSTTLKNINHKLANNPSIGISDIRRHSASDRFFSSIMEHAQDAIIGTNDNGTIISWNRAAEEMFGLSSDQAIGQSIISLCGGDWYPCMKNSLTDNTDINDGSQRHEITAVRNDGKTLYLEIAVSSVKDISQELLGYSVIIRNIADRKLVEQALLESEARYRTVVETASDGVITIDSNSVIRYFNPAAENIFGYQSKQILGKCVTLLMPRSLGEKHLQSLRCYLESGDKHIPWSGVEVSGVRKNGEEFPLEISFGEYQSNGNHLFTGIVRDISERKKMEDILRQSNIELENRVAERTRELSEANKILEHNNIELRRYAYAASHDLKSPLRSISGFAQLLQNKFRGKLDEEADHWIERVVDNTQKMQNLLENILDYSRINSNTRPFETIDCNEIVSEVLSSIESTIRKNNAEIIFNDLPRITGDRAQIVQLLQSLIENGLTYNSSQIPRISIAARSTDTGWEFSITDNGIGIDEKHFEGIFTIFSRLHAYHEYPGLGIGLSVCRRIVHQHGGQIWLESSLGKGSSFYFSIPYKPDKRQYQ